MENIKRTYQLMGRQETWKMIIYQEQYIQASIFDCLIEYI